MSICLVRWGYFAHKGGRQHVLGYLHFLSITTKADGESEGSFISNYFKPAQSLRSENVTNQFMIREVFVDKLLTKPAAMPAPHVAGENTPSLASVSLSVNSPHAIELRSMLDQTMMCLLDF